MAFFVVISAFIIFHGEQFFALPLQKAQTESASQFLGEVSHHLEWSMDGTFDVPSSLVLNVSIINDEKACIPPIFNNAFIDMGCKSKITYDDFQENRIPQLLSQVKCVSSLPSLRYRSKRIRTVCEEVRYNLPVAYRNSADDANVLQYKTTVNSVSVACIRSQYPSPNLEKMSPFLGIEDIE